MKPGGLWSRLGRQFRFQDGPSATQTLEKWPTSHPIELNWEPKPKKNSFWQFCIAFSSIWGCHRVHVFAFKVLYRFKVLHSIAKSRARSFLNDVGLTTLGALLGLLFESILGPVGTNLSLKADFGWLENRRLKITLMQGSESEWGSHRAIGGLSPKFSISEILRFLKILFP